MGRRWILALGLGCALSLAVLPLSAERPRVYAITGATLVPAPGEQIESGTIILRDGLIEAVGASVEVPPDAVEVDGDGLYVYPGLIDPNTQLGLRRRESEGGGQRAGGSPFAPQRRETPVGAVHPLSRVHPEQRAAYRLVPFEDDRKREAERYRELGFTTVLAAPDSGIFRGSSAVIQLLDDTPVAEMILRNDVAQHLAFESGRFGQGYPTSLMGCVAAIRQTLLDAQRYSTWTARYATNPKGMPRPEQVAAYDALSLLISRTQPAFFHADSPDDFLLADRLTNEFDLSAVVSASGHEWEIVDQVRATGLTLILPVAFPEKPKVDDEDEALDVDLRTMRRYAQAPAASGQLHEAGVRFAFTTQGLKNLADFPRNMRKILEAGLPEETALAALTTVPAELLGIDSILGTLEPGKIANLVAYDGPIFGEETKAKRIFVDGVEYKVKEKKQPEGDPDAVVDPRGDWSVVFEFAGRTIQRTWTISGKRDNYSGTAETQSGTVSFDEVKLLGNMLTVMFPARGGRSSMELTVVIQGDTFEGSAEMGPRTVPVKGTRTSGPEGGER